MATIKEVMENLPNIFKPGKAKGWNRVILFDLGGEEPSKWTLTIKDGTIFRPSEMYRAIGVGQ